MAAQISHIIAGEAALGAALARPEGTEGAGPFFALGCQGPDIFYHNRRTMPSGLHYGALAHRRNYGSIIAAAASSLGPDGRSPSSPGGAYVLGLATHAAVDRATHPFIIYFSGWANPADPSSQRLRGCHPFLERVLDVGLLSRRFGLSPKDYALAPRLGLEAADCAGLVKLWEAGLRAAYPRSTGSDLLLTQRVGNALSDALHFYQATAPEKTAPGARGSSGRDASRRRTARRGASEWLLRQSPEEGRQLVSIIYPPALPPGFDALNEAGGEWLHPSGDGRSSTASYLELLDQGTAAAAAAISEVMRFWRGEIGAPELAGLIGEEGLALVGADGANQAPLISRPLPLSEAMEAEYLARTRAP